jgi:hypothetical protein
MFLIRIRSRGGPANRRKPTPVPPLRSNRAVPPMDTQTRILHPAPQETHGSDLLRSSFRGSWPLRTFVRCQGNVPSCGARRQGRDVARAMRTFLRRSRADPAVSAKCSGRHTCDPCAHDRHWSRQRRDSGDWLGGARVGGGGTPGLVDQQIGPMVPRGAEPHGAACAHGSPAAGRRQPVALGAAGINWVTDNWTTRDSKFVIR